MKILVLAKRFTSGKDAVKEDFGRQVRLAEQLQKRGHQVDFLAVDYKRKESFTQKLHGMKMIVSPVSLLTLPSFILYVKRKIKNYDAVFAASDPLFGILAMIGNKPIMYDIQDNYDDFYFSYKIPFVKALEARCIRKSALIVSASPQLAEKFGHLNKNIIITANGMDPSKCKPIPKEKARKMFGFPKGKIVAYAGRYSGVLQQGIDNAIKAVKKLPVTFLLIGDGNPQAAKGAHNVISYDNVEYSVLMKMLSAADVFLMLYPHAYGKLGYVPYKLAEYMGFSKPIVCSDVGIFKKVLATPELMYKDGDVNDLTQKIKKALKIKKMDYSKQVKKLTWDYLGKELDKAVRAIAK